MEEEKDYCNGFMPKIKKYDFLNYSFYPKKFLFTMNRYCLYFLSKIYIFIWSIFSGFKVKNKKVLKKNKGNIVFVSNHVFMTDAIHLMTHISPKNLFFTMLETNLGFGIASYYFRHGGGAPIPTHYVDYKKFYYQTIETLKNGGKIVFFPEGNIYHFSTEMGPFKKGAFSFAYEAKSVIIPCVFTFKRPTGLRRIYRKRKPICTLTFLEPVHINEQLDKNESIQDSLYRTRLEMVKKQHELNNWEEDNSIQNNHLSYGK